MSYFIFEHLKLSYLGATQCIQKPSVFKVIVSMSHPFVLSVNHHPCFLHLTVACPRVLFHQLQSLYVSVLPALSICTSLFGKINTSIHTHTHTHTHKCAGTHTHFACRVSSLLFLETSAWLLTPDHCYLQSSSFEVQQEVRVIARHWGRLPLLLTLYATW